MRILLFATAALAPIAALHAQSSPPSITFYELPAYLGRSVTATEGTPNLTNQSFANRARSARVIGEWQVCPQASYAGTCRTLTSDSPVLKKSSVVSVRPTGASATAATTTTGSAAAGAAAAGGTAIDIDSLDASAGTEGQDVSFFAQPALSGSGVSAGSNDMAAASAFCKMAGYSTAAYAARARTQTSGLIDVNGKVRTRGFPLRDVLCRR